MKYLLLLLLTGCVSQSWKDSKPPVNDPIPIQIALGTDGIVEWRCELSELNDKLVWIPCKFHNTTNQIASNTCINVSYFDNISGKLVVSSNKVCSGIIQPNNINENYAAFCEKKRQTLQRCGELLNLCVMLASPFK